MEEEVRAVHQALHQRFGLAQRHTALQVDGVHLLEELFPEKTTQKCVSYNTYGTGYTHTLCAADVSQRKWPLLE